MFIEPIYELIGNGLRVHFKALKSALIDESKVPKGQDEPLDGPIEEPKKTVLTEKIIQLLRENPKATYDDLMLGLGVSRSTIKRTMGKPVGWRMPACRIRKRNVRTECSFFFKICHSVQWKQYI